MGIPNFSTIERLLLVGGGKADDIYDRMMSLASPKGASVILNTMDDHKNKSSQNLEATRTLQDSMGYLDFMTIFLRRNTEELVT